jgi:hypothetical protein
MWDDLFSTTHTTYKIKKAKEQNDKKTLFTKKTPLEFLKQTKTQQSTRTLGLMLCPFSPNCPRLGQLPEEPFAL